MVNSSLPKCSMNGNVVARLARERSTPLLSLLCSPLLSSLLLFLLPAHRCSPSFSTLLSPCHHPQIVMDKQGGGAEAFLTHKTSGFMYGEEFVVPLMQGCSYQHLVSTKMILRP
jgi:hypothetical protein